MTCPTIPVTPTIAILINTLTYLGPYKSNSYQPYENATVPPCPHLSS
jgi:hypothetical protein